MKTVRHILHEKGTAVFAVSPDASVCDAVRIMDENDIGVLVITRGENVIGIISERDIARKIILNDTSAVTTPVSDIMTTDIITVTPDKSIDECMALMTSKHIRHLPVIDGKKLAGLISIGDVVKATITEKEQLIKELQNYISG
jgi:CBS domain-containing protein